MNKKSKINVNYGKKQQIAITVKITNINSNSNLFTNLINPSYSFSVYLFIY